VGLIGLNCWSYFVVHRSIGTRMTIMADLEYLVSIVKKLEAQTKVNREEMKA
jgi:hypothetical protein